MRPPWKKSRSGLPLVVVLRQHANFEGWLKVELAYALEQREVSVSIEAGVEGTTHRADLQIITRYIEPVPVMLKTINWGFAISLSQLPLSLPRRSGVNQV